MSVAHIGKLQENTMVQNAANLSRYALSMDPDIPDRGSWNALFSHSDMRYPDVKCWRTEHPPFLSGYEISR